MSLANKLQNVYNNLDNKLTEQSELISQISKALVGKVASPNPLAKEEQEKTISAQAYSDTSVVIEPDDGKTLSKVTVNIDVKDEQEKTINITSNGTQVVLPDTGKTLSKVAVTTNIEGGGSGGDADWLELRQSISSYSNNNVIVFPPFAFAYCSSLTSIDLPVCRSIGSSAFYCCSSLTSVDVPVCSSISMYAFAGCTSLTSIDLPMCTSLGAYAFQSCSSLTSIDLPNVSRLNGASIFYKCISLMSFTLMQSSVVQLVMSNIFTSTPMSVSTLTGSFGSIYVPASLVDAYKSATNWTVYADRITAIVE